MAVNDFVNPHKLVSVFGTAFGTETWSFGIRMNPNLITDNPDVSQAQADSLKASTLTFWTTAGLFFPGTHTLQGVKLAPIGVNGKYPPGKVAYIGDIVDTVGPSNTNWHPAQCAMVMTLLSATVGRGRNSKGRVYLPMPGAAIGSSGTAGGLNTALADAFKTLLTTWNGLADIGTASIMSRETATLPAETSSIGFVRADNVPDTQRRRRRSIVGTRYTSAAV